MNPSVTAQMNNIYTTGEYVAAHPTYHIEDSRWKATQIKTLMDRHNLKPKTVCEVGCGVGEVLNQLQGMMPEGVSLDGYDISPQAIKLSAERANARLRFHCDDFLTKETPKYDLLLGMDVIEHVDDYIGFLGSLRPRGDVKLFHIPLDLSAQTVFRAGPLAKKRSKLGHLHYFTKDTALATLAYAKYEVMDWMYTRSGVDKTYSAINWLAKYPRRLLHGVAPDFTVRVLGGYSLLVLAK